MGTFQPNIQKDNGMDVEGYHTYLASTNDNQTYPIKYKISSGAVIEAISSETPSPILNIIVQEVPQGGNLTIQLPTKLLGLYSAGGYSVAEGAMCAAIIGTSFPTPIESNLNFTTVEFPLMNYSGVDEMIYITGNYQQPSTTSEFPSPLKQFKSGISVNDVKCQQDLQLVIKSEDGSPACVKSDTAQSLVKRGWALPSPKDFGYNPGRGPATLEQQSSENSTKLNHVIDIISISGTGSLPNPGGPEIQLTLMNIGTKPVTNLNATLVLNNNYTFNFKDVTESNPLASGHSTSDTQILIGAGFRTELAYPIIISGITNNIPFAYTENVHMP
jgi:hypothetical protein